VQELISTAQPLPEFIFDALVKEHGSTLAEKNRIMAELAELVKLAPEQAQKQAACTLQLKRRAGRQRSRSISPCAFLSMSLTQAALFPTGCG
jgi:hypothetical protein